MNIQKAGWKVGQTRNRSHMKNNQGNKNAGMFTMTRSDEKEMRQRQKTQLVVGWTKDDLDILSLRSISNFWDWKSTNQPGAEHEGSTFKLKILGGEPVSESWAVWVVCQPAAGAGRWRMEDLYDRKNSRRALQAQNPISCVSPDHVDPQRNSREEKSLNTKKHLEVGWTGGVLKAAYCGNLRFTLRISTGQRTQQKEEPVWSLMEMLEQCGGPSVAMTNETNEHISKTCQAGSEVVVVMLGETGHPQRTHSGTSTCVEAFHWSDLINGKLVERDACFISFVIIQISNVIQM